jgi:hypothetical protein
VGHSQLIHATTLLGDLRAIVDDVLRAEQGEASVHASCSGERAVVTVRPTRPSACPVELWADLSDEQVGLAIGRAATPYERVFTELTTPAAREAALAHLRELLTAIVRGSYRQERLVRRDGTLVLTRGIFQIGGAERSHIARSSLSLLRRRRRELITYDPY